MRVLVTGGLGFTGAALVLRLLDSGHDVVVLDKQGGLFDDEIKRGGAQVTLGSITDRDTVSKCCEGGIEVTMHLAAAFREIGVPDSLYKDVNVTGTQIVAEESMKAGVRKFVYCNTQGIHGHIENPPGDETSPVTPEDYYQVTKHDGEQMLMSMDLGEMEYTILRPTAIYGPGDPSRFLMIYERASKGFFPMFGNGKTFYHPLYIDNLVDAFVLAMAPGAGAGEAYIIADADYLSIEELVLKVGEAIGVKVKVPHFPMMPVLIAGHVCEKICKPFGINPPIFPRRVDWFRQVRAFKIDKARRDLGYEPKVGIEEGLKKTGDWYKATGRI